MANINVECPHCRTTLETPDTFAGKEVQCPACGQNFVVVNPYQNTEPPPPEVQVKGGFFGITESHVILILAALCAATLLIASLALILSLTYAKVPELKFKTKPEAAVREALRFGKENRERINYFWRKNGDKILKSLEIKEIKINGSWAIAFYKLSLGATEVKKTMFLFKTDEGYWVKVSSYDAKKKCPENWFRNVSAKAEKFEKDSGSFDEYDL